MYRGSETTGKSSRREAEEKATQTQPMLSVQFWVLYVRGLPDDGERVLERESFACIT
jgi:hypothetical protein